MCGIAGIRDEVLAATGGSFARALQALAWRGRDGQGQVSVGGWRLGVARLAITDPGAGQPLAGPQGIAIAFNGAVTSARAEWQQFGSGRRTRNDAELPLLRLHHAGPAHLAPRCGHHAFAVVAPDGRAWLARDPFGEKPLYVVYEGGRALAFASTVPALRALGFEIELDEREVAAFFKRGWHGTPRVAGPGRTLDDARTGVWSADDGSDVPQAAAAWPARPLHARLAAAVERCAAAEVPVGLALSGGIDSACIAACLPAPARAQVHAFQFRARGAPGGERAVAAAVAGALGMRLVEVDGGPELLDDLMLLTRAHGLPLGDPSVLAAHAVAKAAANEGVRVLLSGEGGDELFFGYRRYRAAAWIPRRGLRWLPEPPQLAHGYGARACRALRRGDYGALLEVAPPGVARRALAGPLSAAQEVIPGGRGGLARAVTFDRAAYLRRDLLPKLDLATLFAGVEGRCPFLDPEVVAAPGTEPERARADAGKRALRRAFADALPSVVWRQRKRGFALPLDRWLREDDRLADLLRDRRTTERPHVVKDGLRMLLDDHRAGRVDIGHALWLFAAYETYLRVREESACPA